MSSAFLDANLLIYLNTISNLERSIYEDFYIDLIRSYTLYTDVLVLDELIYVSWKKYGVPYELTLEFVESIVLPYVIIVSLGENELKHAMHVIKRYGLKPSDALHIGVMKSRGISIIISEDKEFDKVKEIKRIWLS